MSFDIAVWYSSKPIDAKKALARYRSLCAGKLAGIEPHPSVLKFVKELTKVYPQIDDLADDEIDDSRWSCAFDLSEGHVIMSMPFSDDLEETCDLIFDLAEKHGLVCFDPQGPDVHPPPAMEKKAPRSTAPKPKQTRSPRPSKRRTSKGRRELEDYFVGKVAAALAGRGFVRGERPGEVVRRGTESLQAISFAFDHSFGNTAWYRTDFFELSTVADGFDLPRGCGTQVSISTALGDTPRRIDASVSSVMRDLKPALAWFDDHSTLAALERAGRKLDDVDLEVLALLYAVRGRRDDVLGVIGSLNEIFQARLATEFPRLKLTERRPSTKKRPRGRSRR